MGHHPVSLTVLFQLYKSVREGLCMPSRDGGPLDHATSIFCYD